MLKATAAVGAAVIGLEPLREILKVLLAPLFHCSFRARISLDPLHAPQNHAMTKLQSRFRLWK
jgi:hypothetical protein